MRPTDASVDATRERVGLMRTGVTPTRSSLSVMRQPVVTTRLPIGRDGQGDRDDGSIGRSEEAPLVQP